jgi:hypothetical protein
MIGLERKNIAGAMITVKNKTTLKELPVNKKQSYYSIYAVTMTIQRMP